MFATRLTIVFLILVVIGIGVKSLEVQADNETIFTISDEIGTGKVLGIHHYTLKQGVDPQEFERFVAEEWGPVVHELYPGVQLMIMKGERGSHVGQYIMVFEMNSLYVRNFYWPAAGESTEAATAIRENCGDLYAQLWNHLFELAERSEWTDYVALVKK